MATFHHKTLQEYRACNYNHCRHIFHIFFWSLILDNMWKLNEEYLYLYGNKKTKWYYCSEMFYPELILFLLTRQKVGNMEKQTHPRNEN